MENLSRGFACRCLGKDRLRGALIDLEETCGANRRFQRSPDERNNRSDRVRAARPGTQRGSNLTSVFRKVDPLFRAISPRM